MIFLIRHRFFKTKQFKKVKNVLFKKIPSQKFLQTMTPSAPPHVRAAPHSRRPTFRRIKM
jgi:hypothetical protein